MTIEIILILFLFYFLVVFGLSQVFIPNLRWKTKKKARLPKEVTSSLKKITSETKNKKEVLERVLDYQLGFFHSKMKRVFHRFLLLFESSFSTLWRKKGFLHCHQQGFITRTLLLNTGLFTDDDIKIRISACYINIHQYLLVNIGEDKPEWIIVDGFAMSLGYPLGEKLHFFHYIYYENKGYSRRRVHFDT